MSYNYAYVGSRWAAGSLIFFLRELRFAVQCLVVTLRQAVVMDTVYAVIHVEYMLIAHILIYFLHKYWMRNSILPFYEVCNCS